MSPAQPPESPPLIQATLEEAWLTLDEMSQAAAVSPQWIIERVSTGLLQASSPGEPATWRFDSLTLRRVRHMQRYERDFDAVPELAALVVDLLDEIATLRAQLQAPVRRKGG